MGFFDKLVKYAKAPLKQVKKDITDPFGQGKQAWNDPLGRLKEGATGEGGDVAPILPQDPLAEPSVEPYADVLGDKDPLALPDDEMLRLKARRNIGKTQRERNMLTKRKSAFIPNKQKAVKSKAVNSKGVKRSISPVKPGGKPKSMPKVGYYDNSRRFI